MSYELLIHGDQKCKQCGKNGVANETGLCLKCIHKLYASGKLDRVINDFKVVRKAR